MASEAVDDESGQTRNGAWLHADLLERLRNYIVEGNLAEGGRIPEKQLCDLYGVSRTPLREALKVLAAEGLIELLPNRGARVKSLSIRDIKELFDLMGGLEALAGRLACEHIGDDDLAKIERLHHEMYAHYLRGDHSPYFRCNQLIHEAILEVAGSDALTAAYKSLSGRIRRLRYAANLDHKGERWSAAVREHELILDALRRKAGPELATILFEHLRRSHAAAIRHLRQSQDQK